MKGDDDRICSKWDFLKCCIHSFVLSLHAFVHSSLRSLICSYMQHNELYFIEV